MLQRECIGFEEAQRAVEAILRAQASDAQGRGVSIAVVDDNGDLISFARMSGARAGTGDIAIKKAYTSARSRSNSGAYVERLKQMGVNVADMGDPRLAAFQGGVSVIKPGTEECVGGVGVSGLAAADDEALAEQGIEAMNLG